MSDDLSKKGLKARRKKSGKEPTHECHNCGRKRYYPCYCPRKDEK